MVFDPLILLQPSNLSDAAQALASAESRAVAGNTTLYWLAKTGRLSNVSTLVDISRLGLSYIKEGSGETAGNILVGASSTFAQITSSPLISHKRELSCLMEALNSSPIQIRNVATLGGSLCSRTAMFDPPVALLALDAKLKIVSTDGEKMVGIETFLQAPPGRSELLTEIQLPYSSNSASSFVKLCRRATGFAVVSAAAKVALDRSSKKIADIRLAVGAITRSPQRLENVEGIIRGNEASIDLITRASKQSADHLTDVVPSVHASGEYKKKVLPSLVREAIISAVERVREGMKVTE